MATPDVVGRRLADVLDGAQDVAHVYPTLYGESPGGGRRVGRPSYIPARRLDGRLRVAPYRLERKEGDEAIPPLADPEPDDEVPNGDEEEDEAEDDKET